MRYVMTNRRAGKFDNEAKLRSRGAVSAAIRKMSESVDIRSDFNPVDPIARRIVVIDAEPNQIEAMRQSLDPDVIIEPEILYYYDPPTGYELFDGEGVASATALTSLGSGAQLSLKVLGGGLPLPHARVEVTFVSGSQRAAVELRSDMNGNVVFHHDPAWTASHAIVEPYATFWTMVVRPLAQSQTVRCPALPEGPFGWWHDLVGASTNAGPRGATIKIGVIDSGCGPHEALKHVKSAGAFLDCESFPAASISDERRHGTHVCALIGARPLTLNGFEGIARDAEIFVARVYAGEAIAGNQADIVNAIRALSRQHQVDLINLSLGTPGGGQASQALEDEIADSMERGTLCIAASGNSGASQCAYPAMYEPCVAVSALGMKEWAPPGSLSSHREPTGIHARYGDNGLFLSKTSNHGTGLDAAGAGVGIVAAVPDRHGWTNQWAVMDGTSMAAPIALAVLANALSADANYQVMPRDKARTDRARQVFESLQSMKGFKPAYAGRGVPMV